MKFYKFTFIELLVVIGVLSILISILLPVLRQAREMSMRTVSLSNLKQIGVALFDHASQNNGMLPSCRELRQRSDGTVFQKSVWTRIVSEACGPDIFVHPGKTNPNKNRLYSAAGTLQGISKNGVDLDQFLPRYIAKIHNPSESYLIVEAKMKSNGDAKGRIHWGIALQDFQKTSPELTKNIDFPFANINSQLRGDSSVGSVRFTSRGTVTSMNWNGQE